MRSDVLGSFLVVALAGPAAAPAQTRAASKGSFFADATQVVAAFKAKIPAPLLITELSIHPAHASLQAKDPRQKDTFDDYHYSQGGEMRGPEPVQVFTVNCKKGFSIDEADFTAVPAMLRDAVARLNLEDAATSHVLLSRGVFCKEVRWMVYVDGKRKDGMVEYDPRGRFRNSRIF